MNAIAWNEFSNISCQSSDDIRPSRTYTSVKYAVESQRHVAFSLSVTSRPVAVFNSLGPGFIKSRMSDVQTAGWLVWGERSESISWSWLPKRNSINIIIITMTHAQFCYNRLPEPLPPPELAAFIWIDVKDSLNAKTTKAKFPLRLIVVKNN